jgi:hypothetical protein
LNFLGLRLLSKLFRVLRFSASTVGFRLRCLALLLGLCADAVGLRLRHLLLLERSCLCGLRIGLSLSRAFGGLLGG